MVTIGPAVWTPTPDTHTDRHTHTETDRQREDRPQLEPLTHHLVKHIAPQKRKQKYFAKKYLGNGDFRGTVTAATEIYDEHNP